MSTPLTDLCHQSLALLLDPRTSAERLRAEARCPAPGWEPLFQFAADRLVVTHLQTTLLHRGAADAVPEQWRPLLALVHTQNRARNQQILGEFCELCTVLNAVGVQPIALKGIGLVLDGSYPDPGSRVTGDIDVLLDAAEIEPALQSLSAAGYCQLTNAFDPPGLGRLEPQPVPINLADFRNCAAHSRHHIPPVFRRGGMIAMELHTELCPQGLPMREDLHRLIREHSVTRTLGDARFRMPSITARLLHNVHHSLVCDDYLRLGIIDWRHLIDASVLWPQRQPDTLVELLALVRSNGLEGELAVHLWLAGTLLGLDELESAVATPVAQRAIDDFRTRSRNPLKRTSARLLAHWQPRLANVVSPMRLRRLYGPLPMPLALAKYLRWRLLQIVSRSIDALRS